MLLTKASALICHVPYAGWSDKANSMSSTPPETEVRNYVCGCVCILFASTFTYRPRTQCDRIVMFSVYLFGGGGVGWSQVLFQVVLQSLVPCNLQGVAQSCHRSCQGYPRTGYIPGQDWGPPLRTGYAADGTPRVVSRRRTFLLI